MSLLNGLLMLRVATCHGDVAPIGWSALCCALVLASACSTAQLTQHAVDDSADKYYRYIRLNVVLDDTSDTAFVTNRVVTELSQRDLQIMPSTQAQSTLIKGGTGTAVLTVKEIDRQTKTVVHHRRYGRTALTQMRGRELHDKPVITLRATLSDAQSGQTVFQADYVTQGPWYADSTSVVATLAKPLVKQLEHEGFIAPRQ
jgi:hypothetical protein